MTVYRHTQVGTLVLVTMGVPAVVMLVILARGVALPATLLVTAVLLLSMLLFHSLTVEVTGAAVRIRFGIGLIGRTFPAVDIRQASVVRNHWYYGWGIRWFSRGWLFNVSGLDAVELTMRDGRVYRIGTDEPERLLAAIEDVAGRGESQPA